MILTLRIVRLRQNKFPFQLQNHKYLQVAVRLLVLKWRSDSSFRIRNIIRISYSQHYSCEWKDPHY